MENEQNIVYKVVRVADLGGLVSASYWNFQFELEYFVGELTRAHNNTIGIFCFSTLQAAKNYTTEMLEHSYRILKVQGIGVPTVPKEIVWWGEFQYFDKFTPGSIENTSCIPPGTILYPAVEVLEIVEFQD